MNYFQRAAWHPDVPKVAAGLAIGLAAVGLIYAAAATSAGALAGAFTTSETESHSRAVEFADGLQRVSDATSK